MREIRPSDSEKQLPYRNRKSDHNSREKGKGSEIKTRFHFNWFIRLKNWIHLNHDLFRLSFASPFHRHDTSAAVATLKTRVVDVSVVVKYFVALPENEKSILFLFLSGFHPEEIAKENKISPKAVKRIIRNFHHSVKNRLYTPA